MVEDRHKYAQNGYEIFTQRSSAFGMGWSANLTRDLFIYERTFINEPFIEKHTISTELSNVNREKHKLNSYHVCRRDRDSSRTPIRSLKSLRNKSRRYFTIL